MPPSLLNNSITRIHQNDGQVCRAGTRNHVARVFHMTRRISHDEFTPGCGHEAVGNINRNPLFAFSAQTISKIGKVYLPSPGNVR